MGRNTRDMRLLRSPDSHVAEAHAYLNEGVPDLITT